MFPHVGLSRAATRTLHVSPVVLHPYLLAPHRAAAFADLLVQPCGSVRGWARRWEWPLSRVYRFLRHLQRAGLIHIESTVDGTIVRPTTETHPEQIRNAPGTHPEHIHISPREVLGLTTLGPQIVENSGPATAHTLAKLCIDAMNEIGAFRWGGLYLPIRSDQRRSVKAAAAWITAGLDPDWCVVEVRRQTMVVKRTPVTLGYCQRGVLQAWTARHQTEFRLLQSLPISAPPTGHASSQNDDRPETGGEYKGGPIFDWRADLAARGILSAAPEKRGLEKISELGLAQSG